MDAIGPRPRVTLKIAQTLDGRIASRTGHSRWVTGPASRAMGHALRASHDAVMVGIGTVLIDDPQLTVRLATGTDPIRIVIDSTLRLPLNASVLTPNGTAVKVVTVAPSDGPAADAIRDVGAEVIAVPGSNGRVDLSLALQELYACGIETILVEGEPKSRTKLLRLRLVDELVLFIAPKIIGTGIDAIGDLGITSMLDAVEFSSSSIELLDGDVMFRGQPSGPRRRHRGDLLIHTELEQNPPARATTVLMMREVHGASLRIPHILAAHCNGHMGYDRYALAHSDVIDDQNRHSPLAAQDESLVLQVPVRVAQCRLDSAGQRDPLT